MNTSGSQKYVFESNGIGYGGHGTGGVSGYQVASVARACLIVIAVSVAYIAWAFAINGSSA